MGRGGGAGLGCGDGEREGSGSMSSADKAGLFMDLITVSRVFSIFLIDFERTSCFLRLVERVPRWDSSKTHSWLPEKQRLHGGPFSAPTHFILRRLHTVHARAPRFGLGCGFMDESAES